MAFILDDDEVVAIANEMGLLWTATVTAEAAPTSSSSFSTSFPSSFVFFALGFGWLPHQEQRQVTSSSNNNNSNNGGSNVGRQ